MHPDPHKTYSSHILLVYFNLYRLSSYSLYWCGKYFPFYIISCYLWLLRNDYRKNCKWLCFNLSFINANNVRRHFYSILKKLHVYTIVPDLTKIPRSPLRPYTRRNYQTFSIPLSICFREDYPFSNTRAQRRAHQFTKNR